MSEINLLRVGGVVNYEGKSFQIERMGSVVTLVRPDGSARLQLPLTDLAASLRANFGATTAAYLQDIEERLTERSKARRARDRDLLHLLQTGRHLHQPESDRPAAGMDPRYTTIAQRRRRLAERLVEERLIAQGKSTRLTKTHGKRIKSEMRRLQRLQRRWEERGTLLDGRYVRPRVWRTDDRVMDELFIFLNAHALKSTRTVAALAREFKMHCWSTLADLELPSDSTIRKRISEYRRGYASHGPSAKNRISQYNVPKSPESTRQVNRPGEIVQLDTTRTNVWVRVPGTTKSVRLDVTLALDVATRCIVGLAVTHSTPSEAIGLCLADVLRPKTSALVAERSNGAGEPVPQPFVGRPERVYAFYETAFWPEAAVVDNGKQYVAEYITHQMRRLQIHLEPQRAYTPTDKPHVERAFRTIKEMFEMHLPGFTGGSVHERGNDPQGENLITADEFEQRLRYWIDLYHMRVHEGLLLPDDPFEGFSPLQMFDVLTERTGAIPDVAHEHDWVRFLPHKTAKVQPSRVRVARLDYRSPILRELQGDPMVLATGRIAFHYDPFDLRHVWCFDHEGNMHTLRWSRLTDDIPRFGTLFTSWVASKYKHRNLSDAEYDEILYRILSDGFDHAPDGRGPRELETAAVAAQTTARLTAALHPAADCSEAAALVAAEESAPIVVPMSEPKPAAASEAVVREPRRTLTVIGQRNRS